MTKETEADVKVPIFDGKDYNLWIKRIQMYLKWKRCEDVILREKQAEDKEWDQHELKATI